MAVIFISFIHEESGTAEAVMRFLRKYIKKADIFLASDQWTVYAGEDWLERIKEELSSAKVIILLLSPASVKRPWVNFEAGAAWLSDKVIIPVCFNGLHKDAMPKPYSNFQGSSLEDEDGPYYLLKSIFHHITDLGITPPPLAS